MFTTQRLLILLTAALIGMAFGTTAADAAPKKRKFEVTFQGYWGVNWYVRVEDEEPHHVCIGGYGADGEENFEAWTRNRRPVRATLYADPRKRSFFGRVPLETALERKFTMGQPDPGCKEEYGKAAADLDCDTGSPQWGRFGNPPAYLDVAGGGGRVGVGVTREGKDELIERVWKFCPFWGVYEGDIGRNAPGKMNMGKLFSGKAQVVKGYARQDHPGGGALHEQEGYTEWKMKIRYLKPKKKKR